VSEPVDLGRCAAATAATMTPVPRAHGRTAADGASLHRTPTIAPVVAVYWNLYVAVSLKKRPTALCMLD
jgi:hypothetical protein